MTAGPAGEALLALNGVRKRWGAEAVLDGVDLELRSGEALSVSGGNGAGKTTLLRIAAGVILADAGGASFRGEPVERDRGAYKRALGFLSAGDRGLYARLTVRQNLDFWAGLAGFARARRRERTAAMLAELAIEQLAERRVDRLSMGQRQRVRLAMTFLHEPSVVLLDEPRTSLDESGVAVLDASLEGLLRRGGAVLVVTPDAYGPPATRTLELAGGRLRRFGPSPAAPSPQARPAPERVGAAT